jgi:hypothetical protein
MMPQPDARAWQSSRKQLALSLSPVRFGSLEIRGRHRSPLPRLGLNTSTAFQDLGSVVWFRRPRLRPLISFWHAMISSSNQIFRLALM